MLTITKIQLIKNYIVFHAYMCHLLELDSLDSAEELCNISWRLEEEVKRRKITQLEIEDCIKSVALDAQDRLMVNKYIFPDLINSDVGQS